MTDTDRQAVNERDVCERIAAAMGLESTNVKGYQEWEHCDSYGEKTLKAYPPNVFTDPVAADALMQWLDENGYRWNMLNYFERKGCPRQTTVQVWRKEWAIGRARGPERHPDWKVAFAHAAGKAIKEAERGE